MLFYTRSKEIKDNICQEVQRLQGVWKVTISRPKRSLAQNAYWHSLIDIIAPHAGYSSEDLKDLLKCRFIGVRELSYQGNTYTVPIKSSSLDKVQYSLLLEKTIELAHFYNVSIPPKEYYGYSS